MGGGCKNPSRLFKVSQGTSAVIKENLRLCMLHASFVPDDVRRNVGFLEKLMEACLEKKPDLIVTPELAVSGYEFKK